MQQCSTLCITYSMIAQQIKDAHTQYDTEYEGPTLHCVFKYDQNNFTGNSLHTCNNLHIVPLCHDTSSQPDRRTVICYEK